MRLGLGSLLFLVPLGFSAVAYGAAMAWLAFVFATIGHGFLSLAFSIGQGFGAAGAGINLLHFVALALGFTWLMAGNPPWLGPSVPRVRALFRFIGAAALATLALLAMFRLIAFNDFAEIARSVEQLLLAYASPGGEIAQDALIEAMTPERVFASAIAVALRGGALFSAALVLFFSRQAVFLIARLARKGSGTEGNLAGFFAPRRTILVLSISLPAVLLGNALGIAVLEIAAWNSLVMCALIFIAQGWGVAMFRLARTRLSLPARLILAILFAVALFSPGANLFAVGALLVLGIAETWLQLRVPKSAPPSPFN